MSSLERIDENIWSIPVDFKIFGLIQLNGRATLIRLKNNELWVHSPVALTAKLKEQIDQLGDVRHLVAPSLFHHLYLGAWKEAYPTAQVYAPMGLEKKQPLLQIDHVLSDGKHVHSFDWSNEISHLSLQGMPKVREHIFYHQESQTCIITDLCFFFEEAQGFSRLYLKLNRVYQRLGIPLLFKSVIKDKKAFTHSLNALKQWEVQRLSLCHHAVLEDEAPKKWSAFLEAELKNLQ